MTYPSLLADILVVVFSVLISWITAQFAFRIRFERFEAADIERRDSLARAIVARADEAHAWRKLFETRVDEMEEHLEDHERDCRERWEQLWKEHSVLQTQFTDLLRRLQDNG